ncbi:MAG: hypothetical protein ACHQEM_09470 [Chitinophagales bacterium]
MKKILEFFNRITGLMVFLILVLALISHFHGRHHWRHHGKAAGNANYKSDSARTK